METRCLTGPSALARVGEMALPGRSVSVCEMMELDSVISHDPVGSLAGTEVTFEAWGCVEGSRLC